MERENTRVISFRRSFAKKRRGNGRYRRMAGHSRLYTRAEYTHAHAHTVGTKPRDGQIHPDLRYSSIRRWIAVTNLEIQETGVQLVRVGRIDRKAKERGGVRMNGGEGAGEQYRIGDLFSFKWSFLNGVNFIILLTYYIYLVLPCEIFVGRKKYIFETI